MKKIQSWSICWGWGNNMSSSWTAALRLIIIFSSIWIRPYIWDKIEADHIIYTLCFEGPPVFEDDHQEGSLNFTLSQVFSNCCSKWWCRPLIWWGWILPKNRALMNLHFFNDEDCIVKMPIKYLNHFQHLVYDCF